MPQSRHSSSSTYFGFETVSEHEKQTRVHDVFSRVAKQYDRMNDVMSFGMHRLWKKRMIQLLGAGDKSLIDVASGTGDIAVGYWQMWQQQGVSPRIVSTDINADMLSHGKQARIPAIDCCVADAESLPFDDASFDNYSVAFGLRNMTHPEQAMAEAYRVLRPGGKYVILEFSHVPSPLLRQLYDCYSFQAIPKLGEWIAGDAAAYRYLVESIRRFPSQERLAQMMRKAGFVHVSYVNIQGGIAAIHTGWRG